MMPRLRSRLAAALVAMIITSCSIGEDAAPRDVPVEERGFFGGGDAGGEAAGTSKINLLTTSDADQPHLRSVPRDVPGEPGPVLLSLFAGRNEAEQLETAIPADLLLLGTRTRGQVLTVDVSDGFGELDVAGLTLAVAQIVATATAIDNIERVRLRIDGVEQDWPIGSGALTGRTLSVYDYPGLIESTQPPFPAIPAGTRDDAA